MTSDEHAPRGPLIVTRSTNHALRTSAPCGGAVNASADAAGSGGAGLSPAQHE
ncbi:hypothetical protein AB0L88_36910 [Saccharopolyspora shandongensis]|uniref:hypothetical protein n=1 Tax=Saccharopolyspora shandongensis TaxID=418495 RepID=UPI003430ECD3